jgi:membrane protein implicated in regulation of membrane protease activity
MRDFFPMRRDQLGVLGVLLTASALGFLPVWRGLEVGGVAVFGWWMAGLMVLSPALVLALFVRDRRRRRRAGGPSA